MMFPEVPLTVMEVLVVRYPEGPAKQVVETDENPKVVTREVESPTYPSVSEVFLTGFRVFWK